MSDDQGALLSKTGELPVAVDACGGNRGESVQVEGAVLACREFGCSSILVGPQDKLKSLLDGLGGNNLPIEIVHAPSVIEMDDSPTKAIRRKPDASLCVAYNLVDQGRASSVISSGNSGAMMAAGTLIAGLLPGIQRPAIATLIPKAGTGTPNVILDSGANVECHSHNLVQFAIMGGIYATSLFNHQNPKVALLSNGSESSKGTDVVREAAALLSEMESVNYVGYVEGRDVASDMADVIVCDGFVGNVVLKSMEGCVRLIFDQLLLEGKKNPLSSLALFLSRRVYRSVFLEKFDYTAYGGAPLLGLRRLALVLHGSSDSRAVKNAIRVAKSFSKIQMTERIAAEITRLDEEMLDISDNFVSGVFNRKTLLVNGRARKLGVKGKAEPVKDPTEESFRNTDSTKDDERDR